jgi:hypothetical protein
MKTVLKPLLPSEYESLGAGLPHVSDRLESYEDLAPYFPVSHLDEVGRDGQLVPEETFESHGITINQNFAVGGGFHMETPDLRYYAQDAGDLLHRNLAAALSVLRPKERVQFVWMIQDSMDPVFRRYAALKPDDLPFVRYTRKKRFDSFSKKFGDGSMRQFSAACFLQVPYAGKVVDLPKTGGLVSRVTEGVGDFFTSVFSALQVPSKSVRSLDLLPHLGVWKNRLDTLERSFGAIPGIAISPVHSTDYIRFYRRLLSPDLWDRSKGANERVDYQNMTSVATVAGQCVSGRLRDAGAYFVTGSYYHRILTVEVPPSFVEMGYLMTAITKREILELMRNVQVVLDVTPRSREKEIAILKRRRRFMQKQYDDKPKEKSELLLVIDQMNAEIATLENNDVTSLMSATLVVHIWDRDVNRLATCEESLISKVKAISNIILGGEDMNAFPYFLDYCLPGCPGKGDKHRMLPMKNEEVAPLIPLMGRGHGVLAKQPDPLVPTLFSTDLGTPFAIDLFARRSVTTYSGITVGGGGSGKSFLFNHLIASYAGRNTRVVVIDAAVGTPSFKSMASLMGGTYIDRRFRFNALGTSVENGVIQVPSEEELSGILATLEAILRPGENEPLSKDERSFLVQSVNYLFQNLPDDGVPYLRHLPRAMQHVVSSEPENSPMRLMASKFGQILSSSWTEPGGANVNSRYVDGPDDFVDNWLTVFDLKWVLDRRDLLTVFMTLIFRYITRLTAANERRLDGERERIIVVVDEGWKVLFDQAFSGLFLGLYKAGRSRYVSANLLTQDFTDFKVFLRRMMGSGEDAKTSPVITQSSHFFVANLDLVQAQDLGETLNLPEGQWRALAKLAREDGKFSEYGYLCRVTNSPELLFSRIRYSPLPEELWAYSSNSEDDGKRLSAMVAIRESLRVPGARDPIINEMVLEGWDREGLERLDTDSFVRHVMLHRLSKPMKTK